MKGYVWATALLVGLGLPSTTEAQNQPNVVLIFTDDQGSVDVNVYGSDDLITPHMDGLARKGVRFTQFYAAAPVCSPSRAGLLTGRVPPRAGVPGNVSSQEGRPGMPTDEVTIAEMLRDAGYVTGHVGKWHLGYTPETMPNGQGFDFSFGHMGGCIDNYSHFFYWNGPNRHDLWRNGKREHRDGEFFPHLMVREAKQFIAAHKSKPFFLYWPINVPHYPLQGTKRWREAYTGLEEPRRQYAAFVSTMDEAIGQLITCIDEAGLRENTIIIFQSDHGHSTEERTFGGGGNAGPYRGAKFSLFEGGIRVPAMISWVGRLPEKQVRDQMGVGVDWFPTIAELTGAALPERKLDGKSLVHVVKSSSASSPHETFHWQSGGGKKNPQWAVREGDWKLIGNPRDTSNKGELTAKDRRFLVNLAEDVSETTNVAMQHPDVVERLENKHNEWANEIFAPRLQKVPDAAQ